MFHDSAVDAYNEGLARRSWGDAPGALQLLEEAQKAAASDTLRYTHVGQVLYARSCGEVAVVRGWRLSVWELGGLQVPWAPDVGDVVQT